MAEAELLQKDLGMGLQGHQAAHYRRGVYRRSHRGRATRLFHGRVAMIQVDVERFTEHRRCLFTRDWQKLNVDFLYVAALSNVPRPPHLAEMIAAAERLGNGLSRDSLNDQRIDSSLPVQGSHGCVDCAVEGVGISEGLMGQMACFEIVPDNLDVVEFGCVFWQPLDGEPVFARLDGFKSELADMDRPVVLDQYDRFYCPSWLRTEQMVELLEVSDEVAAALGLARMHNQLARDMIE